MREDEYDALIADPTAFLYETWLPRVSGEVGHASAYRRHTALVRSSMAMLAYFYAFGPQIAQKFLQMLRQLALRRFPGRLGRN